MLLPVAAALGFAAGAGLALGFNALHSNWRGLPGVTPDAQSTVPFWLVQFLGPVLVSVFWTALAMHARSVPRWELFVLAVFAIQLLLLGIGLIPIALAGNGGVGIAGIAQLVLVLVVVAGPVCGSFLPRGSRPSQVPVHVIAGALFPVGLWLGQSLLAPQSILR